MVKNQREFIFFLKKLGVFSPLAFHVVSEKIRVLISLMTQFKQGKIQRKTCLFSKSSLPAFNTGACVPENMGLILLTPAGCL